MSDIKITISKNKNEIIKKIIPNFLCNRYDVLYNKKFEILELVYNSELYYIPFNIQFITCHIGLWLTDIPKEVLCAGINYIFKHNKQVFIVKINGSVNPYSNCCESIDYWIDLPTSNEEYLSQLSKNTNYNLKRHIRKLKEDVGDYKIVKYSKGEIPISLVKRYFYLKKLTMQKGYKLSPIQYLKKYCVTSAYAMMINQQPEAIVLVSEVDDSVYLENITYNPKFSKYSIGVTCFVEMVYDAIQNNKKQIFMGQSGTDNYKRRLSNKSKTTFFIKTYRKISFPLFFNFSQIKFGKDKTLLEE